jgi:hypothetical protein
VSVGDYAEGDSLLGHLLVIGFSASSYRALPDGS